MINSFRPTLHDQSFHDQRWLQDQPCRIVFPKLASITSLLQLDFDDPFFSEATKFLTVNFSEPTFCE